MKHESHLAEAYPFIEIVGKEGKFRPVFRDHFPQPASYRVEGRVDFIGPNTNLPELDNFFEFVVVALQFMEGVVCKLDPFFLTGSTITVKNCIFGHGRMQVEIENVENSNSLRASSQCDFGKETKLFYGNVMHVGIRVHFRP